MKDLAIAFCIILGLTSIGNACQSKEAGALDKNVYRIGEYGWFKAETIVIDGKSCIAAYMLGQANISISCDWSDK